MTIRTGQWPRRPWQQERFPHQQAFDRFQRQDRVEFAHAVVSAMHMIIDECRKRCRVPIGLTRDLRIGKYLAHIVREFASKPGSVRKKFVQPEQIGTGQPSSSGSRAPSQPGGHPCGDSRA